MGNALAAEARTATEDPTEASEDLVRTIRRLLDSQQIRVARETAVRGAELFPGHPWLAKANKVLSSRKATPRPARDLGVDRRKEYEWLRENRDAYERRWVALLEGDLIACADSFEEVLQEVRSRDLKARPLVHLVA